MLSTLTGCAYSNIEPTPSVNRIESYFNSSPIGQTRVDGINVHLYQIESRVLVEVGSLFTYREDWQARFINAGIVGARNISNCLVSRPAQNFNALNRVDRLPFRFWVDLEC